MKNSNSFLRDVTPMCEKSPAVRHAVFALASTYILDFDPSEHVEAMADYHHRQAVKLLDEQLQDVNNYVPGKEDPLLATIFLLSHGDVSIPTTSAYSTANAYLVDSLSIGSTGTKRHPPNGRWLSKRHNQYLKSLTLDMVMRNRRMYK